MVQGSSLALAPNATRQRAKHNIKDENDDNPGLQGIRFLSRGLSSDTQDMERRLM